MENKEKWGIKLKVKTNTQKIKGENKTYTECKNGNKNIQKKL